jgi:hypothetical protein
MIGMLLELLHGGVNKPSLRDPHKHVIIKWSLGKGLGVIDLS